MPKIARPRLTRRQFLTAASATAVTFAGGIAKPYISRVAGRPIITHGI
jgi:phosphodiesterase/alkaline phosphatase D-like protein